MRDQLWRILDGHERARGRLNEGRNEVGGNGEYAMLECWMLSEECVGYLWNVHKKRAKRHLHTATEFFADIQVLGYFLESWFIPDCAKSNRTYFNSPLLERVLCPANYGFHDYQHFIPFTFVYL